MRGSSTPTSRTFQRDSPGGDSPDSLLVVRPQPESRDVGVLVAILIGDPSPLDTPAVLFDTPPAEWLDAWPREDQQPANLWLITDRGMRANERPPGVSVVPTSSIATSTDLTMLGTKISDVVSDIRDDRGRMTVGFDSISLLLRDIDLEQVYRFLQILTTHLRAHDAVSYFHIAPPDYEDQAGRTLRHLFDGVIPVDGPGDPTLSPG